MRIGLVSLNHLRDWTGISRLIDRIAAAMAARGHQAVIIARESRVSEKIPVSAMEYPHELIAVDLDSPAGRRSAREKIAASGLDVSLASVGDRWLSYMPWLFRGSGVPYVIAEPAAPIAYTFERWQPYEHYGSLASADAVQILLDAFVPCYPETIRERAVVIGNPAPAPAPVDLAARAGRQARVIVSAGRFNEADKRFSLLLRAFALLRGDFPSWRLRLVGDGPYWEFYHILAKQLGISDRVDFTGAVDDPGPHFESADVFCLPSYHSEGYGLVYAEAAAYALPLVSCRSCVAASSHISPDMGALAELGPEGDTPQSLAEALRPIMELPPEGRERMGIRARDVFQDRYGGETVFGKWESLLERVYENARRAKVTTLDGIWRKKMREDEIKMGEEWENLGPRSPVWTPGLLESAAAEICGRENPLIALEDTGAPARTDNIRLRCEMAELRRDYGALQKKYAVLLGEFQALAGKRRKR